MCVLARPRRRELISFVLLAVSLTSLPARAADKSRFHVDDYQIDAVLNPHDHKIKARAKVKLTALEDLNIATFNLHNDLRLSKVTDAAGKTLTAERVPQDSSVRVSLVKTVAKGDSATLTFEYEGVLDSADDSPVPGLKLTAINDDTTYLLYAGYWFPVTAYGIDRFSATINVTVPAHMTVIGSGNVGPGTAPVLKGASTGSGESKTFSLKYDKASFPGTIVAGDFGDYSSTEAGIDLHLYFKPLHKDLAAAYAETAVKELTYFITLYGPPASNVLRVVELPDDTVPSAWAPELAGLASRGITQRTNYRLLANAIAHQWWGVSVSPASRDDWWLQDGLARYSEARYVESAAGSAGLQEMVKDMSVGALSYDTVPMSQAGKLDLFSPEFQSLATDKGGMIVHMLRWVVGDQKFDQTMRDFASQYAGKTVTSDDFRNLAEKDYGDKLTWFFSQWLDSTGAPEFKSKYTIYRLGNNKGFRSVGQITQDLDLFRMPVELKIDTDGKTEEKRIDVVGTDSAFTVDTFGRPRRITLDPNNELLKNSSDIKLRASLQRGAGMVQQGDMAGALSEFNKALEINKNSSLAHYRIAEVFFLQHNYQASANGYRDCLNGDGDPRWTEVWSHIQLGKIFDITGQRERATNEYRQALQTNDNTQGALDEARRYLQKPYEQPKGGAANGMQ
ncbi:MAG: peptidase rane alanine aminopeptidase [Acidobacteriaceae bacterium]|nr:peptidase rane alanine aminopeptidase [Acidobacteriaceae bacterium]